MKNRIVIIEDSPEILELVKLHLEKNGYTVEGFINGYDGLNHILKNPPDLLILDLMLPDIDGFEICKELRAQEKTKNLPIIILTARGEEVDRVLGLELGADDYIVKPFSPRELVARIKALLRRSAPESLREEILRFEDLSLDIKKHEVFYKDKKLDLTATEFKVLATLMKNPKRVFTRDDLLDVLGRLVLDRNIDVHITNLRKKLGSAGKFIKTVRGFGYKIDNE
ncbi:MAG: response regulator [candidate division WOR-3 bacterium]|nr:response regulator [candidate division WOR-3 bacterium]